MAKLFDIYFSEFNRSDLLRNLCDRLFFDRPFGYVVTPNLDHLVKLREEGEFSLAYGGSEYVVTDGWPVGFLTRVAGVKAGDVFPGSDLIPAIFDKLNSEGVEAKVYLLGAPPGVNEIAKGVINSRWPKINVCGHNCPPLGFIGSESICNEIVLDINRSLPDIIVVALGAPTQELFCYRYGKKITRGLGFCVGATTEFIAGTVKRAPKIFKFLKLEWLYRWVGNPRRLTKRYLNCLIIIPSLLYLSLVRRIGGE